MKKGENYGEKAMNYNLEVEGEVNPVVNGH